MALKFALLFCKFSHKQNGDIKMKCENCGNDLIGNVQYCNVCGSYQYGEQTNQYAEPTQQYNVPYDGPVNYSNSYSPNNSAPALKLPTDRGLLKFILLGLITFGIYDVVVISRMSSEINITASRYDGKRTIPILAASTLFLITLFIYSFVWYHGFSNRVGNEARRRGYNTSFSASDYWLWNILGSLIFIGPFIYLYRLLKTMNMINTSYNAYG